LDDIDSDSAIPLSTLRRAKRRRLYAMLAAALGGVLSVSSIVLAIEFMGRPDSTGNRPPVSSPSPEASSTPRDETESPEVPNEPEDLDAPPPVTVNSTEQSIELPAWSYCYGDICASGSPPANLPDIGSPDEVVVDFPLPDWSFTAYFTPAGERCGRSQEVPLDQAAGNGLLLRPAGHANTYDVTLFGDGGGDLSVTFRWTTPTDGPLPEPEARVAILSGDPGQLESYGVELHLSNLAETPEEASATITVEADDGDSIAFEAERAHGGCWPEGTIYWDGPDDKGLEATELGRGPFEYTVELTLDGQRYVARAMWPRDEIRGNEPSVALDFTPELPRLR
jgi:hypothetical protein